ncbi:MAG: sigma 54-interacting transcriptional regulator [Pseudomonadota bacterium]
MVEITTTLGSYGPRRLHIRRGRLTCVAGEDKGESWLVDGDVVRIGSKSGNDIVLTDTTVSRRHAEVVRVPDGVLLRDLGSTNGTFVGPVKVREVYLTPDTRFRVGQTELLFAPADEVIDVLPSEETFFENMVGASLSMRALFGLLARVAATELTVMVTGETGTGKELVSRAVHNRSRRCAAPFQVFDCGAVSASLVESELFGHERGAFTGAVASRPGVFEQAHGGTVFLDEIGELPLELQPKLLRVLEQREVRRVGSGQTRTVDVRVVCATNRDLHAEVEAGRFREDLYYRLAVVELHLPPLRERTEDIPLLVDHVLRHSNHNRGVSGISDEVQELFEGYRWPGNVRELRNVVERALPFCDGSAVTLGSLPEALRIAPTTRPVTAAPGSQELGMDPPDVSELPFKDAKDKIIDAFERQYLVDLLERHEGNISRAARAADMDRKSIARLLKKHDIR